VYGGGESKLRTIIARIVLLTLIALPLHPGIKIGWKFTGGVARIGGSDFNAAIGDLQRRYRDTDRTLWSADIRMDRLRWMPEFTLECILQFSDHFGVGLGSGYTAKSHRGNGVFSLRLVEDIWLGTRNTTIDSRTEWRSRLEAVPLTLNAYFFTRPWKPLTLFLSAGLGYYWGKLISREHNAEDSDSLTDFRHWEDERYTVHWEGRIKETARDSVLGFQGAVGMEWNLTAHIGIVTEAAGRLVNFPHWKGEYLDSWDRHDAYWVEGLGTVHSYDSGKASLSGKMWHLRFTDARAGGVYTAIAIREQKPSNADRRAEIDLNGYSLRMGLVFRF